MGTGRASRAGSGSALLPLPEAFGVARREAGAVPGRPGARPGEGTGSDWTRVGVSSSFPSSLELSLVGDWRFGFIAAVCCGVDSFLSF